MNITPKWFYEWSPPPTKCLETLERLFNRHKTLFYFFLPSSSSSFLHRSWLIPLHLLSLFHLGCKLFEVASHGKGKIPHYTVRCKSHQNCSDNVMQIVHTATDATSNLLHHRQKGACSSSARQPLLLFAETN